jgi:hypothetical protein
MSTFDTVRFNLEPQLWASHFPSDWQQTGGTKELIDDQGHLRVTRWRRLQHKASAMRVYGDADSARSLEVSLPRLYYGSNGYLLKPSDAPKALGVVRAKLREVSPSASLSELTRADLALHLEVDRIAALASLRGVKHPRVRSYPREFFGSGLEWLGTRLVVRLYDKRLEQDHVPGDTLRLEFQLGTKALAKAPRMFDGKNLLVENARDCFRDLALAFTPKPVTAPTSLVEFLAALQKADVYLQGRPALDVFLGMKKSEKYRARVRKRVQAADVPEFILYLDDLLPLSAWPNLVDLAPLEDLSLLA